MLDRGGRDDFRKPAAFGAHRERGHTELVGLGAAAREHDLLGRPPKRLATCALARSTRSRAWRPSAWIDDGFPTSVIASAIAARAGAKSGAVALKSR